MRYHISRNGKVIGIHEFQEVLSGINHGTFLRTDYYWKEGNEPAEWVLMSAFKVNEILPAGISPGDKSHSPAESLISKILRIYRDTQKKIFASSILTHSGQPEKQGYQIIGCLGALFIVLGSILPFFTRTITTKMFYVGAVTLSLLQFSMTSTLFLITLNLLYIYFFFLRPSFKALITISLISSCLFFVIIIRNFSYEIQKVFVSLFSSQYYETLNDALIRSWANNIDLDKTLTDRIEVGGIMLITGVALNLYAAIKYYKQRSTI